TTTSAPRTTPPALRARSTAATRLAPVVRTSSTTQTGVPSSMNGPSIHCCRPCRLASLRTKKPVQRSPAAHAAAEIAHTSQAAARGGRQDAQRLIPQPPGQLGALRVEQPLARVEVVRGTAPGGQDDGLPEQRVVAHERREPLAVCRIRCHRRQL